MKLAIIIYSQTGNTLQVADKVKISFIKKGYATEIIKLELEGSQNNPSISKLKKIPDISAYDAYVFASPVQAFSLAWPMKAFLKNLPSMNGKKVAVCVTQQLSPFFGGNRSLRIFKKYIENNGGNLISSDIICWKNKEKQEEIIALADKIADSL